MNSFFRKTLQSLAAALFIGVVLIPSFAAAGQDVKQVVFIRYNLKEKPDDSAILHSFKKTMAGRGYIEGKNIAYKDFVVQTPERESAREVLQTVEKYMNSADMFITTSWTSMYVRSKLAKTSVPQLFVPAMKSSALNMLPSVDLEPETNLSGVYLTYPPEKILRMARLILPKISRYAFVYDSRFPVDILFKAAFSQLNAHERHGMTIYYLDLATGTDTVLQKLNLLKIETFGGAVGLFKNLAALSESKLPIVTPLLFDRDRKKLAANIGGSNIIASLYNSFNDCGKMAAEMTADIFDGKTTVEKTVPRPATQLAVVSTLSAGRLGITIPFSALEAADIVLR